MGVAVSSAWCPEQHWEVLMGQPVCHTSSKANISVVGAAEGRALIKYPGSHQDAPGPLMPWDPSPNCSWLEDSAEWHCLRAPRDQFITTTSISHVGKLRLGDTHSLPQTHLDSGELD